MEKKSFWVFVIFLAKIVCCNQNDRGRDHLLLNVLFAFGSKERTNGNDFRCSDKIWTVRKEQDKGAQLNIHMWEIRF